MLYIDFATDKETYKLRLTTRNVVALEKQLGCNPLAIFGDGDTIPTVSTMVTILHAALQPYQHNVTLDAAYDIFDKWLEAGNDAVKFVNVILDVYKVSGLIPKDTPTADEKN
jgi:hypothetical protein